MSDNEDPYALSDSDEESLKGPPPKINIGERLNIDINRIKENLTTDNQEVIKDQDKIKELEEIKKIKGDELKKVIENFKEGKIVNKNNDDENKTIDSDKPTGLSKDILSQFKNKFEHIEETLAANVEEKLKGFEKELEGLQNLGLKDLKGNFEGSGNTNTTGTNYVKEEIKGKSCDELAKIMGAFANPKIDDEGPRNCAICNKLVYSAEKLLANKNIYHYACFKCSKCSKKLTPVTFYSHEGNLLCKQHMDLILHPDRAAALEALSVEDIEETSQGDDDDDEFVISSKPKQLSGDVVRAGTNIGEELLQIKSLREKKEHLQSSIKESEKIDKKTTIEEDIKSGLVKGNVDLFIHSTDDVDSNVNKTVVDLDTAQIAEVKNRWKTGDVEKEKEIDSETKAELEELRKGSSNIKERFCEKTGNEEDNLNIVKSYNISDLDVTNVAAARKSFLEGAAYQSGPIEKTATELSDLEFKKLDSFKDRFEKCEDTDNIEKTKVDLDIQLGDIKAAFEKGEDTMTPEERAELKKKEIEAEFLRYKLARKLQAQKAKEEAAKEGEHQEINDEKKIEVNANLVGRARDKFKQIEAENPDQHLPMPGQLPIKTPSKWDKKDIPVGEIVNKSSTQDDNDDEEEEYDVKNIMNKFKNIGKEESVARTPKILEDLEGLEIKRKNIRDKFEAITSDTDICEEKRKALEEEFTRLKEERDKALKELEEESLLNEKHSSYTKDDVNIVIDHAHKMTAKWEKIQQKEAKKAQKGQMPGKTNA
ncbi:Zinc finger, LIM-type domain-containing protein [Strongyloides ratti]|uniref:Zinc finger, LIM-type domain-containing protein n=1 Tax=Strongyloides ratti TaxID=34506 RepID=A0A090LPD7_STRRB|nr:Zinc finger, LIM-type domain-containing protein [Strongyloides ratti]CEF71621.1 Zinc finger, LIM-type domain-containing protein [Strongyloides ratti]